MEKKTLIILYVLFLNIFLSQEATSLDDLKKMTNDFFSSNASDKNYSVFNPDKIMTDDVAAVVLDRVELTYGRLKLGNFLYVINSLDDKTKIAEYCEELLKIVEKNVIRQYQKFLVSIFSKNDETYLLKAHHYLLPHYDSTDCKNVLEGEEGQQGPISNFTKGNYANYFNNFMNRMEIQYDNNNAEYYDDDESYHPQDHDIDEDEVINPREEELNNEKNRDPERKNDYMDKEEESYLGRIIIYTIILFVALFIAIYCIRTRKKLQQLKREKKYFGGGEEMNDNTYNMI
jgi:hypothetical protein